MVYIMNRMQIIRNIFSVLLLGAMALIAPPPAHASFTVVPMIVIMQGRDKFAEVTLVNISDEIKSYELRWIFYKMDEGTGNYQSIDQSFTPFDLSQNIAFSPKRVTLKPQEPQKVRLALRLKGEIPPPGEYRAHLEFKLSKSKPDSEDVTREETTNQADANAGGEQAQKGIKVGLGVNVSYSIPVIYRVGEGDATGVIGDVKTGWNKNTKGVELYVDIVRTGFFSAIGRLRIFYTPPGGQEYMFGEIKNANVFSEIKKKTLVVPTDIKDAKGGRFRLVYDYVERGSKNVIFDEKIVNLQ